MKDPTEMEPTEAFVFILVGIILALVFGLAAWSTPANPTYNYNHDCSDGQYVAEADC